MNDPNDFVAPKVNGTSAIVTTIIVYLIILSFLYALLKNKL